MYKDGNILLNCGKLDDYIKVYIKYQKENPTK